MHYSDLIQFNPIESVVQLRESDKQEKALELVRSYVISDAMAERLCGRASKDSGSDNSGVLFQNLLLDGNPDSKGVMVVGNYGSGKSHLMAVVSGIAEDAKLLDGIENVLVRESAKKIAGKYQVIRMEIGATTMALREIIVGNLSKKLSDMDVDFIFPESHEISENKTSLEDMMTVFHEKFPDKGLLVVVDELLDYLRGRKGQELVLDLGFLREIGEVCKGLRFRFMAGVQEAIFDSGRFQFASESLGRVKDRFQQVHIATSDIKFVVANRLLKKSAQQKGKVREYLQPFAKFYGDWNERMDDLVELFPVHPDYIDTFQRVPIVEKRGVLQVLSRAISSMSSDDIPTDSPGLLTFDGFWSHLVDNPAFRANPEVKDVMDCTSVLEEKIEGAFPKKQYKGLAIKIIRGLSVHRLTTNDIHLPIGLTPEELRDKLCLFHQMAASLGDEPSEGLLGLIEVTLKEIRTTVSGQFLSQNNDNRQFFLDLKKTDDYDALVERKAETLSNDDLDRAYYQALAEVLECTDPTSFSGYKIWERDIQWTERKATKRGWLFFGVPSERGTAQPPRDFYLYFTQPFDTPRFKDEKKSDEVFFKIDSKDPAFTQPIRLYAAAQELANTSTGQKKQAYAEKGNIHFRALTKWLKEKFLTAVEVSFEGKKKALGQTLAGASSGGMTPAEQIYTAASRQLSGHFATVCGDYPTFSRLITFGRDGNAIASIQDALRGFYTTPTQTGAAVLDALGLMDGEKITPDNSVYTKHILDLLKQKGSGQVLNNSELIHDSFGIRYFSTPSFRLEPELLIVVLGSLVYSGDLIVCLPGKEFAATDLKEYSTRPLRDLVEFKHLKKPKDWNLPALKAIFELLGLPSGQAVQVTQNDAEPVIILNQEVIRRVDSLVISREQFGHGIPFWGKGLLSPEEIEKLVDDIDQAKEFLESLQAYKTPGQLKNFRYSSDDIKNIAPIFESLKRIASLKEFADTLSDYTAYLTNAESQLPDSHPWRDQCQKVRQEMRNEIAGAGSDISEKARSKALQRLKTLKSDYIQAYVDLYQKARLDPQQDKKKNTLLSDFRMEQMQLLVGIPSINRSQLLEIQDDFGQLKVGQALTTRELEINPIFGGFTPLLESDSSVSASQRLTNLEQKITQTYDGWIQSLLNDLEDPVIEEHLSLLSKGDRKLVETFLAEKSLPNPLPQSLVKALSQALSGLTRVTLRPTELYHELFPGGSPATVEEFKARFSSFADHLTKGQDQSKVRIVLESDNDPSTAS